MSETQPKKNMSLTYPIDAAHLETPGSSGVVATVDIIPHHQNDVEQGLELLGALKVIACLLEKIDGLKGRQRISWVPR